MSYDVAIVGCGPAGIFAALELVKGSRGKLKIVMFDKGPDIPERVRMGEVLCGWGGAGSFSDGKLNLTTEIGGWLPEIVGSTVLQQLVEYVDRIWRDLAPESKVYRPDDDAIAELKLRARKAHMRLIVYSTRHIGSDYTRLALLRAKRILEEHVDIRLSCEVKHVLVEGGRVRGVELADGTRVEAKYVILAPGRSGANWLVSEIRRLGASLDVNPVDIGVRVEVPYDVMEPLTSVIYDPKLVFFSKTYDDPVRTFCVNPRGFVVKERYEDVTLVNGHAYRDRKSDNTNFAILVTSRFTWPFRSPIEYGKAIARLANALAGGGVLVQRLGDLKRGRRSTPERIARSMVQPTLPDAVPGDISYALPHRILSDILEMLEALDKVCPGVASDHTLLYCPEVKFYSARVDVTPELEVKGVRGLYAVGDGAGITRSLMQACMSGIIAARSVLRREGFLA